MSDVQPTHHGYCQTTLDALLVIEACLAGKRKHIPCRPTDRCRPGLIQSGNIFVYEETTSGIKRWTDGRQWSPSRVFGSFLLYRELSQPFRAGEKKRANRHGRLPDDNGDLGVGSRATADESLREYVGSLTDSYPFLENGLLKRTISIHNNKVTHHLVSYYTVDDAKYRLRRPSDDPYFNRMMPRPELWAAKAVLSDPLADQQKAARLAHCAGYPPSDTNEGPEQESQYMEPLVQWQQHQAQGHQQLQAQGQQTQVMPLQYSPWDGNYYMHSSGNRAVHNSDNWEARYQVTPAAQVTPATMAPRQQHLQQLQLQQQQPQQQQPYPDDTAQYFFRQ